MMKTIITEIMRNLCARVGKRNEKYIRGYAMYAIEFEADVQDGIIKIPSQFKELNSRHVKVIALLDILDPVKSENEDKVLFSDEYISEHWRELIMTSSTDAFKEDDDILQQEYGDYLSAKHSS